jgi:branched-chain amino acid transport system substrate-binding protein
MSIRSNLNLGMMAFLVAACLPLGAASKGTLQIGYITPLTGTNSYAGLASFPGLEDEVAAVNAAGGINGYQLKVITYDDNNDTPSDALADAKRLIEQDKAIGIIGPIFSGGAIPIAKIADESHVPMIATTATNVNVTVDESGKVHPYAFRVCFIDPYQGTALADYCYNKLGKRKAAFITDVASPYTVALHQFFNERFTKLGGQVVTDEGYNKGDQEFRAQLAKVNATKADVLVCCADNYKDPGLVAKQAKALGMKILIVGGDGWMAEDILPYAGGALDGAIFTTIASVDDPAFGKYNAEYKAKHPTLTPAGVWGYLALDALKIMENGIKQATANGGAWSQEKFRDVIENTKDLPVFTAATFTFDKATHNPLNKPVLFIEIKDNKFKILESYAPKS